VIFKKTTDGLISDIARKINHLHEVADKHDEDAEVHSSKAADHKAALADAQWSSARARRIAKKFSELIGGE
jgi:hypothetical protein